MRFLRCLLFVFLGLEVTLVQADNSKWLAVTIDNDIFLGNDNGYTNGIYFSRFEVGDQNDQLTPDWLVTPLAWSADMEGPVRTLQAYSLGQIMLTPEDITIDDPPLEDLPYSGTLFFNSTFITMNESYADSVGTVIGIVGPSSGAEATQKWVHEVVGADEPLGWDTQLEDELVFQFLRGRLWRSWRRLDDRMDFLFLAEGGFGTLSSFAAGGMLFRFGSELSSTFATPLLINTRSANPAAISGGWYLYAGARMEYVFNQIFTDGNTYRDSRSIEFDQSQIGLTTGVAYSWQQASITIALFDSNVTDKAARDVNQFGTLTFGWRF